MTNKTYLHRRRDAAEAVAVSESQWLKWERLGLVRSIPVPGLRARRITDAELQRVAKAIENGTLTTSDPAA